MEGDRLMKEPMTVKQLIEKLQQYPQDAEIHTDYSFDKDQEIIVKFKEACTEDYFECPAIVWLR